MKTGECQKMALEMGSVRPKSSLPKEIGAGDPLKKCQKVPESAIFQGADNAADPRRRRDAWDRHAIFACDKIPHLSKIRSIGVVALCVAVVSSITCLTMSQRFPWIENMNMWLITTCLTVLAICELILFSRMTPWSGPGHAYRLFRNPAGSGRTEDV
jgi:hypothetical protein